MDLILPEEDDSTSILLPPITPNKVSIACVGLPTLYKLAKETNSIHEPEILLEASNLSTHGNVKTRSPEYKDEQSVRPRMADESALYYTSGRITAKFCKPSRVRNTTFGQYSSKASNSIVSASFRHKVLSKAFKLGPITYRGGLTIS